MKWYCRCRLIAKWVNRTNAAKILGTKSRKKTNEIPLSTSSASTSYRNELYEWAVYEPKLDLCWPKRDESNRKQKRKREKKRQTNKSHMKWNCSIWTSNEKFHSLLLLYFLVRWTFSLIHILALPFFLFCRNTELIHTHTSPHIEASYFSFFGSHSLKKWKTLRCPHPGVTTEVNIEKRRKRRRRTSDNWQLNE